MFDLTGNPKIDAVLQVIGALYILLTVLVRVLPPTWRITKILAVIVADIRRVVREEDPEKPPRVPPVVGALLVVLASLMLPPALAVGCAPSKDAASPEQHAAALAYTGAVVALEVLDAREAAYLDSIAQPTPEQLKAAEGRVERLKRARDALALVRDWLAGRSDKNATAELGQAARALRLVVEELRADGVRVPTSVLDGLQLAELFAGVAS